MAQNIRVLSESENAPPLEELRRVLPIGFRVLVEDGDEHRWTRLLIKHSLGQDVARIQRSVVSDGRELAELECGIEGANPQRAAQWLKHYLSHVKTIYSLQPLTVVDVEDGWLALQISQAYFWKKMGGILQADGEGFTNREGQHVLWQFESPQSGELEAAVMDAAGRWLAFVMQAGDAGQVEAFCQGEVPAGAKLL